jgi:hypothetical protein
VTCWLCARALLFNVDNQKLWLVRSDEVRWLLTIISMMFFTNSTWDMATGMLHLLNALIKAENPAAESTENQTGLAFLEYVSSS